MPFRIAVKRNLRRRMTNDDLVKVARGFIANPRFPPRLREEAASRRYLSGRPSMEEWWPEVTRALKSLASQPSWALQKRWLINSRVRLQYWIALADGIAAEASTTELWEAYVQSQPDFRQVPRQDWPRLVREIRTTAVFHDAVFEAVGLTCYGIWEADAQLEVCRGLRKHVIEKNIKAKKNAIFLSRENPDLALKHLQQFEHDFADLQAPFDAFLAEMGQHISTGTLDDPWTEKRWEDVCEAYNQRVVIELPKIAVKLAEAVAIALIDGPDETEPVER